jgi:hypothetical protein
VGEGKRPGGFRLNIHLLPPPRIRTERGREVARVRPACGNPGHGGGRAVVQNKEGFTGIRLPYLPWAGMVCRGGSSGGGGLDVVVLGVATLGCLWGKGFGCSGAG